MMATAPREWIVARERRPRNLVEEFLAGIVRAWPILTRVRANEKFRNLQASVRGRDGEILRALAHKSGLNRQHRLDNQQRARRRSRGLGTVRATRDYAK